MNAFLRMALFLTCAVSFGAAAESQVRVAASRGLSLAVVDTNKSSPPREAMHQAFAASLDAALVKQCGGPVGVRAKRVGVDHAAFNLGTGTYDAVLVIGRAIPDQLRRVEAITLSAAPDGAKGERMIYLMIASGDPALQGMLASAFAGAIGDAKFLASLAVAEGRAPSTPAGDKIAAQ